MRRRRGAIRGLVCAAVLLTTPQTWAREGLALVLEPKLEGPFRPKDQARLELAVVEALRSTDLQVVPPSDRQAIEEGEPELKGCRTDECQDRLGRLLSAQTVIMQHWRLTPSGATPNPSQPKGAGQGPRGHYRFGVAVFNVTIGAVGVKEEATCPQCTTEEAARVLGELVRQAVLLEAARPRGKIEVTSTPNGDVLIDGRKLGFTPYKREAYAGKHEVTVTRTGYRSYHTTVLVEDGKKTQVHVQLKQGVDRQVSEIRMARPRWRLATGAVAIAGGALLVGFGISALAVNGRCVEEPVPPAAVCDEVYRTAGVGAGLLVAGLALGAGGAVLMALPGDKRIVEVKTARVGSGLGLLLAGTF
ncbi:MAG: PEGA domain-containing protein [Myxococcales bacterium]|nr:PEGA domain-containing protein [Myxococcota bacterium]MDW8281744.1 PEGA domain-containing protein [Myxococcales bacterium]